MKKGGCPFRDIRPLAFLVDQTGDIKSGTRTKFKRIWNMSPACPHAISTGRGRRRSRPCRHRRRPCGDDRSGAGPR